MPVSSTTSRTSLPAGDTDDFGSRAGERSIRIIEPGHTQHQYLRELWSYRGLVYHMARRDIRLRYAQTLLGLGWPLVQPLLSMAVLTFVFGGVAGLRPSEDVPYAVLVLSGLLPWQLFATGLTSVGLSVLLSSELIERVYFPRLVLPIRALAVALHNAVVSAVLMVVVMLASGVAPSGRIVLLPLFLLMSAFLALALGLFLSVWNALYRDFLHLLPFLLQLMLYASPVGFESRAIPERFAWVAAINPMAAVIDGCRYALLPGQPSIDWAATARSALFLCAALGAGIAFFRRNEAILLERI